MKKAYSCQSIFIFLTSLACSFALESCSDDSLLSVDGTTSVTTENLNEATLKSGDIMPINSDNPYDSAGQIHNELFESYYASENLPQSISAIASRVESIANDHSEFSGIKSIDYHTVSPERVQYIVSHSDTIVSEIIEGSDMTAAAKSSLDTFMNSLLLLSAKEDSGEVLYHFVVNYESGILTNPLLTERDKQIILTSSSIARHSTYLAKKRPKKNTDPDWDLLIGNIIGGTDGADYEKAEAITMALVTGIVQNQ